MKKKRKTTRTRKLSIPSCKHFTGYRPCFPGSNCLEECADPQPIGKKILIVNLEAMGNVLVTTTLLPAIRRKYPRSFIAWLTLGNAAPLLDNNPYLDRVYRWNPDSWLILQAMKFDIVMNIDKSAHACAFTSSLAGRDKRGYGLNRDGVIVPLNREAEYNYRLGLDDHLKFRINQKSNSQLLAEAMGLKFRRDEYVYEVTEDEGRFCAGYRRAKGLEGRVAVGFNTGCSPLYPNKKLTIDQHLILIDELSRIEGLKLVLLGGPEDTERNAEIARAAGDRVLNTPTREGVRRGMCYINCCDVVISGDSFGMHGAIALRKHVIVWFGVSCPPEVDLFERGIKLVPEGLDCSPCWKKECPHNLECIKVVDLGRIVEEVARFRGERT